MLPCASPGTRPARPPPSPTLRTVTRNLALAAVVLALVALVVLPLGVLGGSLFADPAAGLAALAHPLNQAAALNTAALALAVLALALGLGVPLGWLVGRTDLPGATTWRAVCTIPYMVPTYVLAIAWISLLNPTNGLLNQLFGAVGLGPLDIYSLGGMTWVMGLGLAPFVMLSTADALGRMDASLEEQARIAGAGPWRTVLTVTLPMATPGVVAGAGFVLAYAVAAFGVPYLLASGTADPAPVLTTRIYQALDLDPARGRPAAVALSLVLLALGVGLPALARAALRGRSFATVTGKATRVAPFALGPAKPVAVAFVASYAALAVVLPIGTIAWTSVLKGLGQGLGPSSWTLANYRAVLFERSDTLAALGHSLLLASGAATAAVLVGALVAWMAARTNLPGRGALLAIARLPWAAPGTVLAIGLLLTYSQEIRLIVAERVTFALALSDTLWMLGLAYVVKFLAFPVDNTTSGLQAVHPSLEEASAMSGAGFATTLLRITGPLLSANLVASWFLVFLPAFTEVTMSILLAGPDSRVVGTLLFDLQTYGDPPAAAVLAMVVVVLVLGGNGAIRLATRGRIGI